MVVFHLSFVKSIMRSPNSIIVFQDRLNYNIATKHTIVLAWWSKDFFNQFNLLSN